MTRCYYCLCETCARVGCPYHHKTRVELCLYSQVEGLCPRRDCDWYRNARKYPVLRIKRRYTRSDRIYDALNEILYLLKGGS